MSSFSPSMTTTFTVVEPTSTPIHNSSYFFCGFAFSVSPGIYTPLCVVGYRWPADHVVAPASRQLGKAECPHHSGQDAALLLSALPCDTAPARPSSPPHGRRSWPRSRSRLCTWAHG